MFGLFGGNKNKKAFEAQNRATLADRKSSPFERQAMDKQILDSIKTKRGLETITAKDIKRDYDTAKKNLENVLVQYGRGAQTSPQGAFGDGTRDFTPSDFDKEGNLRFFTAKPPTLSELAGDIGRAMPNFGVGAGIMSLINNIGSKFNLNDSFKKLLNIKNEEQQAPLGALQNLLTQRQKELFGSMNPSMNPITAPVIPIVKEGLESIMPRAIIEDFSNFESTDPTGMGATEGDMNMGATDPTGMGVPEGTIYDPTIIGGRPLFPNTPPPGTEVSETDYKEGMQMDRPDIFNEEELNPGFPVLKIPEDLGNSNVGPMDFNQYYNRAAFADTPATYYDSDPISVVGLNDGQDSPQGAFPGGFKIGSQFVNRRNALAGLAYGGDINRSVMNGQNGMSASDKIDNRIMKNLEFQNKYNMGGRAMSTYDKLKSIANSIAEG
jgi:hypothetical protein